jgi:NhaP-type Na+/H+ or K+/H+ antiporter
MSSIIIAFGVLYFLGHVLTHFFDKSKIPDVLILIIFGIIIGPLLGIVSPAQIGIAGSVFTSVALIIILFEGGLDLEFTNIRKSAGQSIKLTFAFFFITAAIIFIIMHFGFNYTPMASAVTGFICGGTSSAVVIPMVGAMKIGKEASTILILESALTDVLCIVFTIGVVHSYDSGNFEIGKIIGNLISSLVLASVIGIAAGMFWLTILNKIRTYQHTTFATFAFMFIVYGIAEVLNFSGAIAALAFGILLGNNRTIGILLGRINVNTDKYKDSFQSNIITTPEKKLYKEIVFLIKIFFFIYLGISIPFEQMHIILIALSIVVAIYAARPVATKFLVTRHVDAYDRTVIGVMIPKGLAAAVLAGLPTQHGMIEGPDIQAITYNLVLISIVTTSVLIPLIERTSVGALMRKFLHTRNLPGAYQEKKTTNTDDKA